MSQTRIGAVTYLNTKPLVHYLHRHLPEVRLSFDLPSRLADQLAAGLLDVALIPAIEAFRDPTYTIVSDACIACRGPVLSVKLFSRGPAEEIRTLALDEGSRTSAAMVQVLLAQRHGVTPTTQPLPIGLELSEIDTDAVLLIGDRAIHAQHKNFHHCWDLGDVWCRYTELPFVFAMWTAREDARGDLQRIATGLADARNEGLANLAGLANRYASTVPLSRESCVAYFRDNLHFSLGPGERQGLLRFHGETTQMGLIRSQHEPRFHMPVS